MDLAEEYNESLVLEQHAMDKAMKSKFYTLAQFFFKWIDIIRHGNFFIGILLNFYLLLKYQDVNGSRVFSDAKSGMADIIFYLSLSSLFCLNLLLLLFSALHKHRHFAWKTNREMAQWSAASLYSSSKKEVAVLHRIKVTLKHWMRDSTIQCVLLYTPVLFLSLFFDQFFVSLFLFDVFLKFPDTLTILRVAWIIKKKIASTICLYVIAVYFFALIAYFLTPLNRIYGDFCENFLSCFSVLLDSTVRSNVASSPIFDAI